MVGKGMQLHNPTLHRSTRFKAAVFGNHYYYFFTS